MHSYIAIQNTYDVFEMALFINNKRIDSAHEDKRHTSKMFIPLLDQLCARNNIKISDVSFCAVNCGPGPFSTLRSIIASVNGLHLATNIPLIGIDGLDATFLEFYDSTYQNTVVLLNAFNNEVYYLIAHQDQILSKGYQKIDVFLKGLQFSSTPSFDTPLRGTQDERLGINKVLIYSKNSSSARPEPVEGNERLINFIGNGVTLHYELIQQICGNNAVIKEPNPPICSIKTIGRLGLEKFKQNNMSGSYLMPLHLKKHAVEL